MSDECGKHNAYFGFCEQCVEEAAEQAFTAGERAATERIIKEVQDMMAVAGMLNKWRVRLLSRIYSQTPDDGGKED